MTLKRIDATFNNAIRRWSSIYRYFLKCNSSKKESEAFFQACLYILYHTHCIVCIMFRLKTWCRTFATKLFVTRAYVGQPVSLRLQEIILFNKRSWFMNHGSRRPTYLATFKFIVKLHCLLTHGIFNVHEVCKEPILVYFRTYFSMF